MSGKQIVFAWMVPITKAEAAFIREKDWGTLEDIFVNASTNLVDFDRDSAV